MGIARVQAASNFVSAATLCTTTFTTNNIAGTAGNTVSGHLIVIVITTSSTSVTLSTITFTGNADVPTAAANSHTAPSAGQIWIYYVLSGAGGASAVTVTPSASTDIRVTAMEYSSSAAWTFDNAFHGSGSGNVSAVVTTTGTSDLIVGGVRSTASSLTDGGITGGSGGASNNLLTNATDLVDDRWTAITAASYTMAETNSGGGTVAVSIAAFTSTQPATTMSVAVVGRATLVDAAKVTRAISAAIVGAATMADALKVTRSVSATISGHAVMSDAAQVTRSLSTAIVGVATMSDAARVTRAMSLAVAGHATLSESMGATRAMSLAAIGTSLVHASASAIRGLSLPVQGHAALSAFTTITRALSLPMRGTSSLTLNLTIPGHPVCIHLSDAATMVVMPNDAGYLTVSVKDVGCDT